MGKRSKQRRQRQMATKTAQVMNPAAWMTSTAETERWTIPQDGDLYARQAELYQRLSWVHVAVSTVSQAAATTAFSVKQRAGEKQKDIPNHPFELLLQRPNPLMSRFEFLEALFSYRRLTGNAYIWLNRASESQAPTEMWVLPSHRVLPVPDGRLYLRGYVFTNDHGQQIPLEPWEVVHLKSFHPLDSFVGLSPIEALATVAIGDMKMQEWNTNFFGKDNGKPAGMLAFADQIDDPTWAKMGEDIKNQHGGTKRAMMRLRGAGKGGVEWIATSISQKDMEFLQARNFNKEEIYSIYAPGLSSVLAVNATEANATAGESTLQSYALWPLLVATGEKITNDILPAYGSDLVGSFDDPRRKDRTLELAEQSAFERTHTIDEVRERYYEAKPIGDDRGKLLLAEVNNGLTDARTAEEKTPPQLAQNAGMTITDITDRPALPAPADQPEEPMAEPMAMEHEGDTQETTKATDLERWERKAIKALKAGKPAAVKFESEAIDESTAEQIREELSQATSAGEVRDLFASIKAQVLTDVERALADKLIAIFGRFGPQALRDIERGEVVSFGQLDSGLRSALLPAILEYALGQMANLAEEIGPDFDPAQMMTTASEWAQTYTFDLVKGMTEQTQKVLQDAVAAYASTPGMTREALEVLIRPAVGLVRAELIAVSEVTRSASQSARIYQQYLAENGLTFTRHNVTNADDRVCSICGPLNGKPEADWPNSDGPPWHPRCRCAVTLKKVKT